MPDLNELGRYRRGAEWALAAAIALELGLLDAVAADPTDSRELAARLNLDPRGVETLLGALAALGAVQRVDSGWRLTGAARARFIDRDTPDFEADSLRHWLRNLRRWSADLAEVVRTGAPGGGRSAAVGERTGRDLEAFMAAMANRPGEQTVAVADAVRAAAPEAATLLDVGGGPGVYARLLAARGFEVTMLDRPEVIELAAERYSLDTVGGVTLVAADFLESFPQGEFDVVFMANVSHIYGPSANRALCRRAAHSLRPGGTTAILDFVRGESEFAPLFALTMLTSTEDGGTWTLAQYGSWLREAGMERVRCETVADDVQLVTAVLAADRGESR